MIVFPNAKINLGLNIVEKRQDGFHNIESVFYPVPITDALEIIESTSSSKITFSSSGIDIPGKAENNLCVKAYELISKDYDLPNIKVHLHKHIPIGAGLGGGSADAAFFIRALNDKFNLGLSWGEMHHYAKQLGSDCSFFITNKPAFVKGKGEEFECIDLFLNDLYIVLIYPNIHINTAKAYAGVKPKPSERDLEKDILQLPPEDWKDFIHNDFEDSIFREFPEIKTLKDELYQQGALYASMSGSGSTVYGLFKQKANLKDRFKKHFVFESKFI